MVGSYVWIAEPEGKCAMITGKGKITLFIY